jgi:hypothetical protein
MTLPKSILNVGQRLPTFTRSINLEKMLLFESVGEAMASGKPAAPAPVNIHTDAARAREMGLAGPVASGQMSLAYLHELLARQFGRDFRQGGRLSVRFVKPVGPGDTLSAHGVVTARTQVEGRTRLTLEVWLENQQGEKTSVGEAQVTIPSPLT